VLEGVGWLHTVWSWMGVQSVPHLVAPVLVVLSVTPVLVVASLLLVALFMTPALVELVAQRRFPALERRKGATLVGSLLWSAGSSLIALIALLVSVPLWFVPPLVVVIPPLIWGWLTYRVMAFDALSAHASKPERRSLFLRHRLALMLMGGDGPQLPHLPDGLGPAAGASPRKLRPADRGLAPPRHGGHGPGALGTRACQP
jgi:hypothetical protein